MITRVVLGAGVIWALACLVGAGTEWVIYCLFTAIAVVLSHVLGSTIQEIWNEPGPQWVLAKYERWIRGDR